MNVRNRLARLEVQSAVGKDPRKMTDQEIDAELDRLRRKLYPNADHHDERATDEHPTAN